jgi:hypothetical protein
MSYSDSSTDDDSSEQSEHDSGIVHNFIRSVFEELVSLKETTCVFSIGWTEINEHNQLLDLLNGNGLVQCDMSHLLEMISIGLKNKNNTNNHNILSIVLEQQTINNETGQAFNKLSTVNFCDLNYSSEKASTNQFVSEPREIPMNFYSQPMLPPYPFSSPPMNANLLNGNYFFPPLSPTSYFTGTPSTNNNNLNFRTNAFDTTPNTLVNQQNQRLLKNAELLFSKLNLNDIEEDQRKEIQEWMYLKTECDSYMPSPSAIEFPPSYFSNMNYNIINPNMYFNQQSSSLPIQLAQPQSSAIPINTQPSSLLPIAEMDETNETSENADNDEEDETNDNDSESGSYIDINDQSNNLFKKINDKISNFQDKADDIVRNKCNEYFENNPKVILSSGQSTDSKITQSDVDASNLTNNNNNVNNDESNMIIVHRDQIGVQEEEEAGPSDLMKASSNTSSSDQYLAKRRRSIRDNILNSDELNLIKKAAAATSFETDSFKDNTESEQLTKLDDMRKSLKKSLA